MLAIAMYKEKPGPHTYDLPRPEITKPDEILIKVKQAGVDGTDFNMVKHNLQDPAKGQDRIIMGHEMVGVVEIIGDSVKTLAVGDTVVLTVRRGCGICQPCLHNQSDMCMTGLYTERGIHKKDGFFTEYLVDEEQYAIKVPADLAELAVFTEPLSIAEKGVEQIRLIQSRMPWACEHQNHSFDTSDWGKCKTALVVGAGPLGILATAILRLADVYTYVVDIVPDDNPKVHMVRHMGANYIDGKNKTPKQLVEFCCTPSGNLDIVFEASGAAVTAVELINYMSRSSIYVMTGIPRQEIVTEFDAAQLVRQIVRNNQVVVGSVNSNRSHFEMALKDIPQIEKRFGGMLKEMITHRFGLKDYEQIFAQSDPKHIKTVIDIG
jgi:threonine dehydrogenase-like Zn-dependent dehydrogenase